MNVLPEAFATASIAGLWLPRHWTSSWWQLLYRVYTYLTVVVMLLVMISQLMALIFLTDNVEELVESAYLFLTGINAWIKSLNMLIRRRTIIELTDMFTDSKCIPRDDAELKLCSYFNKMARYMVLSCMGLAEVAAGCMGVWPLFFISGDKYILSLRGWQPYEITDLIRYSVTQTHQMIAILTMALWCGSSDVISSGFMIKICSQLQLMCHRLKVFPDDVYHQRQLLKQSVMHHLHIFEIKRRLEIAFTPVILSQYLLSTLVLCISVYQLTSNKSDIVQTSVMFLYLSAMVVELLMYCWFGNEVTVTSLQFNETVYQSDWTKLHVSNRKGLLIMMLGSSLPIRITCGPFITLSTDTCTSILKLSYSAFNFLQRSH